MSPRIPIVTERLTLREFEEADWEAVHEYASDPFNVRYMKFGPNTEEETKAFIERVIGYRQDEPRRNFNFAVVRKSDDRLIGAVGLDICRPEYSVAELGYIYHKDYWGKGYATEAARALLAFGFMETHLHRVYARCFIENTGSAHVLEKIWMQREGCLRQDWYRNGEWHDKLLYAILEDEWIDLAEKMER